MAEPSLQLGNGNWAGKSGNLLAYHKANNNFYADELTFTRASTGTIVNADGLIEEVPYNLATYSEQFDNGGWSKTRSSISVNATIAPNGTLTADKLIANTDNNSHFIQQAITTPSSVDVTFSVYAKAAGYGFLQVNNQADNSIANFDLSSGVLGTISGYTATIEDVGNGWYRCSATRSFNTAPTSHRFAIISSSTSARLESFTGNGTSGVYIYGAQLNSGSTAKTYYPTTTRLNVPRVDYLNNANGSLLLESQRTNFMTYSNDFSNAAWGKAGGGTASAPIVSANQGISPDGTNNAFKVELNLNGGTTSSDRSRLTDNFIGATSTDYTFSFYAKAYSSSDVGKVVKFSVDNSSGDALFTLTSEWKRFVFVGLSSNTNINQHIQLRGNESTSDSVAMLLYGYQAEQGSYATSYIPTSGTTATRNRDRCDNGGNDQVINSNEGVLYAEISSFVNTDSYRLISLNNGDSSNNIFFGLRADTGYIYFFIQKDGVTQLSIISSISPLNSMTKIALKFKENDCSCWINGVQIGSTDTSVNLPSGLNRLDMDFGNSSKSYPFAGNVKDLQIFKTALTDTELATLTTI